MQPPVSSDSQTDEVSVSISNKVRNYVLGQCAIERTVYLNKNHSSRLHQANEKGYGK